MSAWTVGGVIKWSTDYLRARQVLRPRLDAELLLAKSLGLDRLQLYLRFDQPLSALELAAFKSLLKRRVEGEPAAYILGRKAFWSFELKIAPGVLIPRPETETLVEAALERLPQNEAHAVADLGTGGGPVALAVVLERPLVRLTATDICDEALTLARENAASLGLQERIEFRGGDLFEPIKGRCFDMILMNPPYVSQDEYEALPQEIRVHEPAEALLAGADGLMVIRRLVAGAPAHLTEKGWLLFEIGAGQGEAAGELLKAAGFKETSVFKDLAGRDRVAAARQSRA